MYCYKKTTESTENTFIINKEPYSLQECDSAEAALVEEALKENWYIRMYSYSEEESGGWSGTKSHHSFYRDIKAENAVIDGGRVVGFRVNDVSCDPEVAQMFFAVENAGKYFGIKREKHYSFDGGDGDGVTSYSFALEKKDKRIVEFINTYCFCTEEDNPQNKAERICTYEEIAYDSVEQDGEGRLFARRGMDRYFAENEGRVQRIGGRLNKTITLKRK